MDSFLADFRDLMSPDSILLILLGCPLMEEAKFMDNSPEQYGRLLLTDHALYREHDLGRFGCSVSSTRRWPLKNENSQRKILGWKSRYESINKTLNVMKRLCDTQ
jgi:hypothetical protein